MTLSDRYRRLATLIDALEAQGLTVRSAAPSEESDTERTADTETAVTLEIELPSDATLDQFVERTSARTSAPADSPEREQQSASDPAETELESDSHASTVRNGSVSAQPDDGDAADSQTTDGVDDTENDSVPVDASTTPSDPSTADDTNGVDTADTAETDDNVNDTADTAETDDVAGNAVDCTHSECDRTFETERGMKIHRTKAHSLSELLESGADEAAHCDPDVLARVYEEYDTFAEMTDALDVDVGPQAVRKQMIRHDIHQPGEFTRSSSIRETTPPDADDDSSQNDSAARNGGADENTDDTSVDDESVSETSTRNGESVPETSTRNDEPAPESSTRDGESETADEPGSVEAQTPHLDLPNSLSVPELQTAVEEATTLYDVQRALGLGREESRDLLREYDLLELVTGRAATVREREELKTEIHERLQRAAT